MSRIGRILVAAAMLASSVVAAPIPGIFNSGVDAANVVLAGGAVDPHFTLISSPGGAGSAFVINESGFPLPSPWLANTSTSKWIGPSADQSVGSAPGEYIYRLTFDLTGFNLATAVINGSFASDNAGFVRLNGVDVPGTDNSAAQFLAFTPFTLTSGFVSGLNSLDFVVLNSSDSDNPTGLRVELTGTAEFADVPEPASFGLIGLGLVGLAAIRRNRK
jgi:hypothetical protein